MSTQRLNDTLLKELAHAGRSKFTGALLITQKKSPLEGHVYFYQGGIYNAQVSGYYPRLVQRLIAAGILDQARFDQLMTHFGGNDKAPEIGAWCVENGWLNVEKLSELHQEYLLAALGALASLPDMKIKKHKGESTPLFNTVPLPVDEVKATLDTRATRYMSTWVPISPHTTPGTTVPSITDRERLESEFTAPEIHAFAAACDGTITVDQVAWVYGFTRAEAAALLGMLNSAGVVSLAATSAMFVDADNLMVPEAAADLAHPTGPAVEDAIEDTGDEDAALADAADNIPTDVFENTDAILDEPAPVVKEKRGLFGRRRRKNTTDEVDEPATYNVAEWVGTLSDDGRRGYAAPAPTVDEDNENADDLADVELNDLPAPHAPAPATPAPDGSEGMLARWATFVAGSRRDVRLAVLDRTVNAARTEVEDKRRELETAEANLAQATAVLNAAIEYKTSKAADLATAVAERDRLTAVRTEAQAALDTATEAITVAMLARDEQQHAVTTRTATVAEARAVLADAEAALARQHDELNTAQHLVENAEQTAREKTATRDEAAWREDEHVNGHLAATVHADDDAQNSLNAREFEYNQTLTNRNDTAALVAVAEGVLAETLSEAERAFWIANPANSGN